MTLAIKNDSTHATGAKGILLFALLLCITHPVTAQSQSDPTISVSPFKSQLDSTTQTSDRFVVAHGRRGFIAGDASTGLEAWVYPFQIFKNYRASFCYAGSSDSIRTLVLSKIEYHPESITRIYEGLNKPDIRITEKLFMPLDSPGALITYTVVSKAQVQIKIHLTPVMGLMWPADLSPTTTRWDNSLHALLLHESTHGYSALISSPQFTANSFHANSDSSAPAEFALQPDATGSATLAWVLSASQKNTAAQNQTSQLEQGYQALIENKNSEPNAVGTVASALQVETPDPAANQAIRWSEIALDQAWSCNPDFGCGFVAGYGPSRIERRPQYAWFFAGDGLVAADGTLSAGDTSHARDELEFIMRYQDKKSGMIWHELTQSASLIDWASKYPYFFAHVDTTLNFLSFVSRYVQQSGDTDFLHQHWPAIQLAYHYASSLIDPKTGLPMIPAGKEGGNEQTRMIDDLGLSTSWIDASAGYSQLAKLMGNSTASNEAAAASLRARAKIQPLYWSDAKSFWISGHTINGATFDEQHSGPSSAIDLRLFDSDSTAKILNRIAAPDFRTPWGIRSVAANSPGYSPGSYAQGSVWPVGTAAWAQTFWLAGRSATAYQLWHSLITLSTYDSAGHLHEVFRGDAPIPQAQSVPEQTWSSAAFLSATVHGLLGIEANALVNQLIFAPHLPAEWPALTLSHLNLGSRQLGLHMSQTSNEILLRIHNPGSAFHMLYKPELPHGAHNITATQNHMPIKCEIEDLIQSTIAHIAIDIPTGATEISIHFAPKKVAVDSPPSP